MAIISGQGGGGSGGLKPLLTVTRATTGALDTGASAIPTGHGSLYVVVIARSAAAATTEAFTLTFNGDTGAHYDDAFEQGSSGGTTGGSATAAANISAAGLWTGNTETASYAATIILQIPFYDNTNWFKTALLSFQTGGAAAATLRTADICVGWRSTAAVNQITFDSASHLLTNSVMQVYGTQ